MKSMSTPQQHPSPRENLLFAHRAATLTVTLVGSTILLLQVLSGTNPLLHLLRLAQLVSTLYLIVFLLGILARSTWGDLAPQGYGTLLYRQAPVKLPLVMYIPQFVAQVSLALLLLWTVRLQPGLRHSPDNHCRGADSKIVVHKCSFPFRLFGQAPLRLPW